MTTQKQDDYFKDWKKREEIAETMIPIVGRLYRDREVVTNVYGRKLVNKSTIDILRAHRFARQILNNELSVHDTYPTLEAVSRMDLGPARLDIGKLTVKYQQEGNGLSLEDFLKKELAEINTGMSRMISTPQDVVLYGFGRIGRLLARLLVEMTGGGDKLRLRAAVVRKGSADDLVKRASLLRRDSVHGHFQGTITVDEAENALVVNGNMIRIIYAGSPEEADYTRYGIKDAILIDNTGAWRDREGLGRHLKSKGISRVLLTAPGKGDIPNIVYGVNNEMVDGGDAILSAASCTTNAIVPVLKAVNDRYGIVNGHVETCHSYTNDQNLIDNYHNKERRGRSAALNMVITETGAAKAVAKALPELAGKLTGNAIRVPTPNVSMAILNLTLDKEVTTEELNSYLREISLYSDLQNQIDFTNSPEVVSSDFVGSRHAGIVDSLATITQGNRCVLYVWYDNEFGYSCQVVRIVERMAGLNFPSFPK